MVTFRRHINQAGLSAGCLHQRLADLRCRHVRMDSDCESPAPAIECIHLVFHQCNQGRYYYGETRQEHSRQLIGQRLPSSGGKHTERIAPAQDRFNEFMLSGKERLKTEALAQNINQLRQAGLHNGPNCIKRTGGILCKIKNAYMRSLSGERAREQGTDRKRAC